MSSIRIASPKEYSKRNRCLTGFAGLCPRTTVEGGEKLRGKSLCQQSCDLDEEMRKRLVCHVGARPANFSWNCQLSAGFISMRNL